ncbi:MAG: hypothetical protein KC561_20065, partial [Myxococcales bacterium]|nr:hypothetical protein [Myxococcales bacterium]
SKDGALSGLIEVGTEAGRSAELIGPMIRLSLSRLRSIWPAAESAQEHVDWLVGALREKGFDHLVATAARSSSAIASWMSDILRLTFAEMVQLHAWNPPVASALDDAPSACPIARWQVARDQRFVTNLWHEPVDLTRAEREVLSNLDGNHAMTDAERTVASTLLAKGLILTSAPAQTDASS